MSGSRVPFQTYIFSVFYDSNLFWNTVPNHTKMVFFFFIKGKKVNSRCFLKVCIILHMRTQVTSGILFYTVSTAAQMLRKRWVPQYLVSLQKVLYQAWERDTILFPVELHKIWVLTKNKKLLCPLKPHRHGERNLRIFIPS